MLSKYVYDKPQRTNSYKFTSHIYDFFMLNYPVTIKDIPKFERGIRQRNVSISVFGMDESDYVFPLYIAKEECEKSY